MTAKQILKKAKGVAMGFVHLRFKKYVIVLILGVVIVGFLGDNSVVAHLSNKQRIGELKAEIAHHLALTRNNQEQIEKMQTDPKAVEKVGRERYFMKMDDEDVFVLSDDQQVAESVLEDESVE